MGPLYFVRCQIEIQYGSISRGQLQESQVRLLLLSSVFDQLCTGEVRHDALDKEPRLQQQELQQVNSAATLFKRRYRNSRPAWSRVSKRYKASLGQTASLVKQTVQASCATQHKHRLHPAHATVTLASSKQTPEFVTAR